MTRSILEARPNAGAKEKALASLLWNCPTRGALAVLVPSSEATFNSRRDALRYVLFLGPAAVIKNAG